MNCEEAERDILDWNCKTNVGDFVEWRTDSYQFTGVTASSAYMEREHQIPVVDVKFIAGRVAYTFPLESLRKVEQCQNR